MNSKAYQNFLDTLLSKVPNRKTLVQELVVLLNIEKEAVYRRLRKEVLFSFYEIDLICQKYYISLDFIFGRGGFNNLYFHLIDYDFINTSEKEFAYTRDYLDKFSIIKNDPDSEIGCAYNYLPLFLVNSREHLNIYYFVLYKWMYQYGKYKQFPYFNELKLPERLLHNNDEYREKLMYANYTYYVLDEKLFICFVNDILYFKTINFITDDDIRRIKSELFNLLDYMEKLTIEGKFETGKKVDFFVTQISIEASYSYLDIKGCSSSNIKLFSLSDLGSHNRKNIPRIKDWLLSLRRSSTLISVSGELQRIKYFDRQRKIIDQL